MMTPEDNELLTRVENGAPMGEMLRENYWFPAVIDEKLVADGAPVAFKLLGEKFVAFRSTDGRVGVFDEHCPHRRASLLLARNEDNALRCIYHGWKFGVDGTVIEVPTEPNNQTDYCKNVPLKHYPTREAGGMVWVWLGRGEPKRFPDFEFNTCPPDRVYSIQQKVACNWVQDCEGGLDSAHVSMLHYHWLKALDLGAAGGDFAPVYEFEQQPAGYRYAALRNMPDGNRYVRVTQFVMPWVQFIAPEEMPEGDRLTIMSVPIDDTHTMHWMLRYNRVRALKPSFMNPVADRANYPPLPPGDHSNSWGQDRDAMSRGHWSGFHHVNTEDFAATESQGPIADRSKEYLNAGDRAVMRMRKQLLDTVKEFVAGKELSLAKHEVIPYPEARSATMVIGKDQDWRQAS